MTPRKVCVRVAHTKGCEAGQRTALHSLAYCNCEPSYYTFHRDRDGRPVKGARVKSLGMAQRSQREIQLGMDLARLGLEPVGGVESG